MKTIRLTYNQSKELVWNSKPIRIKRSGDILYIFESNGEIIVRDWNAERKDFKIIIDEWFID